MLVSNVSLWGAVIVACFVLVGSIVLGFFDRKMLRRVLAVFGVTVAQMAVIAVVVWVVYQTNAWWAYLAFYLLVLFLSICWVLYPVNSIWKKMLKPVSAAMLAGSIVVGGSTLLCLPVVLVITAATFAANVLAGVIALLLIRSGDSKQ